MKPKQLWSTTIIIWTDYDPQGLELEDLAREATSGDALCETQHVELVTDTRIFPDTDFFGDVESEEENLAGRDPSFYLGEKL